MLAGREKELAVPEKLYNQYGFVLYLLFGNYGVGKTTMLEEFCRNKKHIIFTARPESSRTNLEAFSRQILSYHNDKEHAPFLFWENIFKYILDNHRNERCVLVIDEFTEIAERDVAFMTVLQNAIDLMNNSQIFLILVSSDVKFTLKNLIGLSNSFSRKITAKMYLEKYVTYEAERKVEAEVEKQKQKLKNAKVLKFSADDVLLREGEVNNSMYKIISGSAMCYLYYGTEKEYLLGSLKSNNIFGEYSLLTNKPGIFTVVALSDMLVLRVGRDEFQNFLEMNASYAVEIMKNMAKMMNMMKYNIDMLTNEMMSSEDLPSL